MGRGFKDVAAFRVEKTGAPPQVRAISSALNQSSTSFYARRRLSRGGLDEK